MSAHSDPITSWPQAEDAPTDVDPFPAAASAWPQVPFLSFQLPNLSEPAPPRLHGNRATRTCSARSSLLLERIGCVLRRKAALALTAFSVALAVSSPPLYAGNFSLKPGDILVANNGADSIMKIDAATGEVRNLGSFSGPTDIALKPDGRLYVSEFEGSIFELNLNSGERTLIKAPSSPDPLFMPDAIWGLLIAPDGALIATRGYDDAVVRIDPATGDEQVISETNWLWGVAGIDLLDNQHVIVCSTFNNQLVTVALSNGDQTPIPTTGGGIDQPRGIAVFGNNIYTTTVDSSEVRRISTSGGVVDTFYTAASTVFGMAVETNGNLIAGMDQAPFHVLRLDPTGTLDHTYTDPALSAVTGVEISRIVLNITGLPNTPPTIDPIPDHLVAEGSPLSLIAHASDTDWPPQRLSFSLGPNSPSGAVISSLGVFSWTPNETFGPGIYPIQVIVTDDDSPALSAAYTFAVTVTESNSPPSLSLTNATVFEGDLLSFQVAATDIDTPLQTLSFALLPGAPAGATITTNGLFNWTPTDAQGPGTASFDIKVTDNGTPPLSATARLEIAVNELYLQCSSSVLGPYLDEPGALFDKTAGTIRVTRSGPACFYRLRSNLLISISDLHLSETESFLNYQLQ